MSATSCSKEESKKKAEEKVNELLSKFKNGEAQTAEAFGKLAKEHSEDGSAKDNGLIEDIYPGMTVEAFDNWCFDASRQVGDVDIITTKYGYHVIYFDSFCDITYRDKLIDSELRSDATTSWIEELAKAAEVVVGNVSRMNTDRTMA